MSNMTKMNAHLAKKEVERLIALKKEAISELEKLNKQLESIIKNKR